MQCFQRKSVYIGEGKTQAIKRIAISTERMYENETNDNHMYLACNAH